MDGIELWRTQRGGGGAVASSLRAAQLWARRGTGGDGGQGGDWDGAGDECDPISRDSSQHFGEWDLGGGNEHPVLS